MRLLLLLLFFPVFSHGAERVFAAGPPASVLVFAIAPHLPFGWFDFPPGANRLLGIWWAGKPLYPEAFDADLRAKAAEFHRLFYHREPTAAQLDALLGEPGVLAK